jgi:hypothetical protein
MYCKLGLIDINRRLGDHWSQVQSTWYLKKEIQNIEVFGIIFKQVYFLLCVTKTYDCGTWRVYVGYQAS